MIAALAEAGAALAGREKEAGAPAGAAAELTSAAVGCAEFVRASCATGMAGCCGPTTTARRRSTGSSRTTPTCSRLRSCCSKTTCEERWFALAVELAEQTIVRFADAEQGGFFSTPADHSLIVRRKELEDSPIPAGGSSAAAGLLRLAELTGDERYERHGESVIALLGEIAPRHPAAFGHLLQAMQWRLEPARPIACAVPSPHPPGR